VAAYGFFGMGNIGNEGSLAALLGYLREVHPDLRLSCFATGVAEVQHRHGVAAVRLMAYQAPLGDRTFRTTLRKAVGRICDIPRTFALLRDVDLLVVPGTGVLETKLFATPWGLPYWLFVTAVTCRLRGRPFVLLSVGAEHAAHPITRAFHRWTARLASYASYRDAPSVEAVRAMGVRDPVGEVVADLAFSLPVPAQQPARSGHVVVGVMAYDGDPRRRDLAQEVRCTYAGRMTRLVTALLERERTVTLVTGDRGDLPVAEQIATDVRAGLDSRRACAITVSAADSMEGLMAEMARAEVVVASRFHNLICALRLSKPVVSFGYAGKSAHLLNEFGLGGLSQSIDDIDVALALTQIDEAPLVHAAFENKVKGKLSQFEADLDAQFRALSEQLSVRARRGQRRAPMGRA
jgi:polysaccharide pyruvyl transferase WcaK-like protein